MAGPKPKYDIDSMIKIIEDYTETTELPILKEVCYFNGWNYDYLMKLQLKYEELYQSIKILLSKKEVELERGGLSGKYCKTMAVFSLKQLGWKDRQEIAIASNTEADKIAAALEKAVKTRKGGDNERNDNTD